MNLVGSLDARLVLLFVGFLLTILAGAGKESANAFMQALSEEEMIAVISTVMGYHCLMEKKGYNQELTNLLHPFIGRLGFFLIPLTVVISFGFNILLPSALGCAAVVGSIMIPLLKSINIMAKVSACAVVAGTFGSVLNLHSVHSEYIARIAGVDISLVIQSYSSVVWLCLGITAVGLWLVALMIERKSLGGIAQQDLPAMAESDEPVNDSISDEVVESRNYLQVCLPLLPMVIIILGSIFPIFGGMKLTGIMVLCSVIVLLLNWETLRESTVILFNGMGEAFSKAVLVVVAAAVFVNGLEALNVIGFIMGKLQQILDVKSGAAVIPFILALITGSGDSATMIFNSNMVLQGLPIMNLGSLAYIGGALGRVLSPLAGSTIICAYLAGSSLGELVQCNAIGIAAALIGLALIL